MPRRPWRVPVLRRRVLPTQGRYRAINKALIRKLGTMTAIYSIEPAAVSSCSATDKAGVLAELAARFAAVYGLDQMRVLDGLEERESLGSTGFGRGVAIPHARIEGVGKPVCAVLRLASPIEFAAADGMPVDIVFGLLSPDRSGAVHLHALAAISRLMRDERMRERLIEAPDDEAAYALLVSGIDRDAA
jgi:PTS system nitrogen regulatory IIA component